MKRLSALLSAALFIAIFPAAAFAGNIVYSLPKTSLILEVEAVCEHFHAGPYAEFAKKYLGIDARKESKNTYSVSQVNILPRIEADLDSIYTLNTGKRAIAESGLFSLTSQGLVVMTDSFSAGEKTWRFPSAVPEKEFNSGRISREYTSENVELYKMVRKNGRYEKVSVHTTQSYTQKSTDRKAMEAAEAIFNLRKKREQIITGDTDAVFDGEALGAAVSEINRLEAEYLSLFIGYTDYTVQKMSFDFIPDSKEEQMYVAFRISDSAGLLPADNMSGRPVVAVIEIEDVPEVPATEETKVTASIHYRIPATATIRIMDQTTLITQSRIPLYQFGAVATIPATFIRK